MEKKKHAKIALLLKTEAKVDTTMYCTVTGLE